MFKGIVWLGTRTERFDDMRAFMTLVVGREPWLEREGFAVFDLPNGDRVEVFGPGGAAPPHDAPVAGFLVEDVDAARTELASVGIEFLGPVNRSSDGNAWVHFRAPDGHIYELTSRPDHESHSARG